MRHLTQRQLGEAIGLSAGQIHKIERGLNQASAGLLYQIANILDVPIIYFYGDFGTPENAIESRKMLTELIVNFSLIQDGKRRDAFSQFVRILAAKQNLP